MSFLDTLSYISTEVRANYGDRYWWKGRFVHRILPKIHTVYPGFDGSISVMEEDWDNLFILDACRADLFEQVAEMNQFDRYRRVTSNASMTEEWTLRNFAGKHFDDTVYVTGNPYISKHANDSFYALEEVWYHEFDEAVRTVQPESLVSAAEKAHAEYPNKRLIVHFMQPHYPFIGASNLQFSGLDIDMALHDQTSRDEGPTTPWEALEHGLVDRSAVWTAYRDNLTYVLKHAFALADHLSGKTVVTSDHGNMIGERTWPVPLRLYGHPRGVRHPSLTEVPWGELDGERRDVTTGRAETATEVDQEALSDHLRDLGYRT